MAIALRNVTTVDQSTGSANITINKPTGTVDGDVLYALIEADGSTTVTAPTGWTLLDTRSPGSSQQTKVYRKVASGEGASWTWTTSGGATPIIYDGMVASWTGVDTTTVTDGSTGGTGNSTTAAAPTLTPTQTNDASVVGYSTWNSSSTSLPTGYTSVAAFGSNGDLIRVAWKQLASASATGAVNSTISAASQWTGQQVLFLTAGGGGGGGGTPRLGDANAGWF